MSGKVLIPTVVALGYFDSVHLGHRQVIETAKALAEELNVKPTVFTFGGNLRAMITRKNDKYVYSADERADILKEMGIDSVFVQRVDFDFLSMGKHAYLNWINKKFDIKGYVCGKDYKFGMFAKGSIDDLAKYAESKSQILKVVDTLDADGKRISTSRIKLLLSAGDLKNANALLGRPFSLSGTVVKDRGVGTTLGFPTANLKLEKHKQPLREGVYAGHVFLDGTRYDTVVNFGTRPTFGGTDTVIEAHIAGFNGDLYDKKITLFFDGYIREIRKFFNEEDLKKQLTADLEYITANSGK